MSIRSNVPEIYLQNYTSVDTVYIECVGNVATAKETAREEGVGEGARKSLGSIVTLPHGGGRRGGGFTYVFTRAHLTQHSGPIQSDCIHHFRLPD